MALTTRLALRNPIRNAGLLQVATVWYFYLYLTTILLSLVNSLNHISVIAAHALFLLTLLLLIRPRPVLRISFNLHTVVIGLLSSLVFLQGLFSAPNSTDSLAYHLPRIMYWIQGRSVLQSQTFTEHDFLGPFGEYVVLHLYLLTNSDLLAFASQWLAYLGMILTTMKIAGQLGVPAISLQFVGLLSATIPMAVLQASSTQVDLVTSFLFLLSIHFALQIREQFSLAAVSLVAITVGLGILTKATMLIFALVPAGIVLRTIANPPGRTQKLLYASLQIITLAVILGPFVLQNERLYQSPLGRHQTATGILIYTNEVFSPASVLSNIVRNLISQVPMPFFGNSVQAGLVTLHNVIGIDLNDPRTTWYGEQFRVMSVLFPQEDLAANPLQLVIFCIAGFGVFRSRSSMIAYLYVSLIAAFCLFSGILKWQPWHSRLLLPLFSLSTVVSWAILLQRRRLLGFALATSASLAVLVLAFNVSRPLISYDLLYPFVKQLVTTDVAVPQSIFVKPRIDQYFNPRPYWEEPYREITSEVAERGPVAIGIDLMDGFEYPFWVLLKQKQPGITILPRLETSQYIFYTAAAPRPYQRQHCIQASTTGTYGCYAEV